MILPRRAIFSSALAVALVAVAVPSLASAAKPKPIKVLARSASASTAVTGTYLSATATCPKKTSVLSGGFHSPIQLPGPTGFLMPLESVRVGARQWRASGLAQVAGGATQTLTAYAYCARVRGKVTQAADVSPFAVMGTPVIEAEANCPKARLLSGGFAATPAGLVLRFVYESAAVYDGWRVAAISSGSNAGTLTAYAYCFKPAKIKKKKAAKKGASAGAAAKKKTKKKAVVNPKQPLTEIIAKGPVGGGSGSVGTAVAPCPGKLRGIAGGFTQKPSLAANFLAIPESARFVSGVWTVSAFNYLANPGTLLARSLCG